MNTEHLIRSLQGCDFDPEPQPPIRYPWILIAGLAAIGVGYAIWRVVAGA